MRCSPGLDKERMELRDKAVNYCSTSGPQLRGLGAGRNPLDNKFTGNQLNSIREALGATPVCRGDVIPEKHLLRSASSICLEVCPQSMHLLPSPSSICLEVCLTINQAINNEHREGRRQHLLEVHGATERWGLWSPPCPKTPCVLSA